MTELPITVVIPTYQRERVLVETLRDVCECESRPMEVVVVDQTPHHEADTIESLDRLQSGGVLRRINLDRPSIPHAMNVGLQAAQADIVLFLDDDISPSKSLIAAHANAHVEFPSAWAVAGQVLQPEEDAATRNGWTPSIGFHADLDFPFWSNERAWVSNVMAGNLSVKRNEALAAGGFDENFEGVAYRFETEFARRLIRRGGKILFEPAASIRHLRASRGGTRSEGSHLTSASPRHGVGDYYFAMQAGWTTETISYMLKRPFREVTTKFHLRHPWSIPVKLVGEARAFARAWRLKRRRQVLLTEKLRVKGECPDEQEQLRQSVAPETKWPIG